MTAAQASGRDTAAVTQDVTIGEALIADIVAWRIPPGAWIREREVAERFGVSHAPVREALRYVARAGFVEVAPFRGARVIEIDAHDADEIWELWKALYGVAVRMAAVAFRSEHESRLRELLAAYVRVVEITPDPLAHTPVGFQLGDFICRISGADLTTSLLVKVARLARWQHKLLKAEDIARRDAEASRRSAEIYRRLCDALIRNDPAEAEREAHALISNSQALLTAAVQERISSLAAERSASPVRRRRQAG